MVAPCFVGDRLVGWAATRAHHADVGGSAPGSLPADAVEIFAEGLRIPPVRLTAEVRALILAQSLAAQPASTGPTLPKRCRQNLLGQLS